MSPFPLWPGYFSQTRERAGWMAPPQGLWEVPKAAPAATSAQPLLPYKGTELRMCIGRVWRFQQAATMSSCQKQNSGPTQVRHLVGLSQGLCHVAWVTQPVGCRMFPPEVAPIESDQEPFLPIDGLISFHSECATAISLVSCKTVNGDFPVSAFSILLVFKKLKDREKRPCLSIQARC